MFSKFILHTWQTTGAYNFIQMPPPPQSLQILVYPGVTLGLHYGTESKWKSPEALKQVLSLAEMCSVWHAAANTWWVLSFSLLKCESHLNILPCGRSCWSHSLLRSDIKHHHPMSVYLASFPQGNGLAAEQITPSFPSGAINSTWLLTWGWETIIFC